MNNRERGLPYHYDDTDIIEAQQDYLELLYGYNRTRPKDAELKKS